MIIGIPKETKPFEYRVAATPKQVGQLVESGHRVIVAEGAGDGASFTDGEYAAAGADLLTQEEVFRKAELLYKVKELQDHEFEQIQRGQAIFTYLHSNAYPEQTQVLLDQEVTGIAYEDVTDVNGRFPLLAPMSVLAGKGGFLAASHYLQSVHGGPGILLASLESVAPPVIAIIGGGISGMAAAEMALALGNQVILFENNPTRIAELKASLPENGSVQLSNKETIAQILPTVDVLINCVLWPKTRKDHLVDRAMLSLFKPNALIVDVACDEGGAIESCRSTTHEEPTFLDGGVRHYCVDNIPSGFARVASQTLGASTLPHVLAMAEHGIEVALKKDPHLRRGLSFYKGQLTLEETGRKWGLPYITPEEALGMDGND